MEKEVKAKKNECATQEESCGEHMVLSTNLSLSHQLSPTLSVQSERAEPMSLLQAWTGDLVSKRNPPVFYRILGKSVLFLSVL